MGRQSLAICGVNGLVWFGWGSISVKVHWTYTHNSEHTEYMDLSPTLPNVGFLICDFAFFGFRFRPIVKYLCQISVLTRNICIQLPLWTARLTLCLPSLFPIFKLDLSVFGNYNLSLGRRLMPHLSEQTSKLVLFINAAITCHCCNFAAERDCLLLPCPMPINWLIELGKQPFVLTTYSHLTTTPV